MITLQDVQLTDAMLRELKYWQDEEEYSLESDITCIDDAITFIACEHECPMGNTDKEALSIIANLSFIKRKLRLFNGKEGLK